MGEWLEHMPWIPLDRGVPLVQLHVAGPPVTRGWVALGPDTCTLPSDDPSCTFLGNANSIDRGFMRVDLDDPLGFAYAFHHACWIVEDTDFVEDARTRLIWAVINREVTDEDRVIVAKALQALHRRRLASLAIAKARGKVTNV